MRKSASRGSLDVHWKAIVEFYVDSIGVTLSDIKVNSKK